MTFIQALLLFLVTANAILSLINYFIVMRYKRELKREKEKSRKIIQYIQSNKEKERY